MLTILRDHKEGEQSHEEKLHIEIVRREVVLKESRLETTYEPYGDGIIAHPAPLLLLSGLQKLLRPRFKRCDRGIEKRS